MCRYKYGDGFCAHNANPDLKCIGEENCTFKDQDNTEIEPSMVGGSAPGKKEHEKEEKTVEIPCAHTKHGIYCQKYKRFCCVGKGNCSSEEEYHKNRKEMGLGE